MNMKPIESRITEEAKRRASEELKGFSVLSVLEPFSLDPETEITIAGPHKTNSGYGNSATLTISQFDEAFRQSIFKTLTDRISEVLLQQFVEKTAGVDLTAFEITNQEPQEKTATVKPETQNSKPSITPFKITRRTVDILSGNPVS